MVATSPARSLRGRRAIRVIAAIMAVIAMLVLGLWLGVPPLVKHVLQTNVAAALHRTVSVERVEFNPLTLNGAVHGVTILERDGKSTLLAFDELDADLSLASLWHRAPVIDRMRLTRPRLALTRNDDGSYSIQDLLDDWLGGPPGPPARFSFNNIEVIDGSVDVDDRPVHRKHQVRDLSVGIPFLSSLPYQTTIKVLPRVVAKINGSPFALTGTTTPFAAERDAALDIDLDAVSLPEYMAYLPVKLRGKLVSGTLTTRAKLVFTEGSSQSRSLWLSGQVTIDNGNFQRPDGSPVVAFGQAAVHIARLDVLNHHAVIDSVTLEKPSLDVQRAANGVVNLAEPMVEPSDAPSTPAQPGSAWRVDVEKVRIDAGAVRVVDDAVRPAFRAALSALTLDATDLSTAADKPAHLIVSFDSDIGSAAHAEFDLLPMTLEAKGRASVDKLSLKRLYPYYADALNLEVQGGAADIALDFETAPGAKGRKFAISNGEAAIADLRLALSGERDPLWRVPRIAATGLALDATTHKIDIATLATSGGQMTLRRDADGTFNFARMMKTTAATGHPNAEAADDTWTLSVKRASVDRYAIDFNDRQPTPPVTLQMRDVELTADNLTNARGKRANVALRAKVGEGGSLAVDGPLATNPLAARWHVVADKLPLAPLQPYVDPIANVTMTAGTLSANGRVAFGAPDEGAANTSSHLRWSGDIAVNDFAALDRPTSSDLAHWKRLALGNVDIDTGPLKLDIGSVSIADFFARVIVYSDASLNFVRLLSPGTAAPAPDAGDIEPIPLGGNAPSVPPAPTASSSAVSAQPAVQGRVAAAPEQPAAVPAASAAVATSTAATPSTAAPAPTASALPSSVTGSLPLTIGRIELARGNVQYTDLYIRPNYSANLTDVSGSISAMSVAQAGNVSITAKVDNSAPVNITGRINPLAHDLLLDLAGKASDIDLPPLSPYSTKYAGYGITKGKLSFDVSYKLENRKLDANNRIVLDQLTFGDHVDSPTATRLPVLLAVALLKDVHGVIDISLPVSGSLDDPKFSVGHLIIQVIVNLLTKAVTSPFALLGAAFGGGEELSYVQFEPGSVVLDSATDAKLDKLAKALVARPSLRVDITGHTDAGPDGEALRHAEVDAALRAEKVKALTAAGTAVPDATAVTVTAEEHDRYLAAAYKAAPIKERPRNFIGILKDATPAEMEALLYAHAALSADRLAELATDRAQAVQQALVKRGVAPERLFIVAAKGQDKSKEGSAARVDLGLK